MNQITFLPQDLIKAADNKADSSGAEPKSQDRDDSFSSLVEQHSNTDSRRGQDKPARTSGKADDKRLAVESGKERPPVKESESPAQETISAEKNAEPITDEPQNHDNELTGETGAAENTGDDSDSQPDKGKDPQSLIDLLGASAKLLQQQSMAENGSKDELSGDVNIDAELMEDGASEISVLAKLKGAGNPVPGPTAVKELKVTAERAGVEGEAPEAEMLAEEAAAKQADKAQLSSDELLAKLKAGEGEAGTKEKAGRADIAGSDKKLSPEELVAKARQQQGAEHKELSEAEKSVEGSIEEILPEKPLSAVKITIPEGENGVKKPVQFNKAGSESAKAGTNTPLAQALTNKLSQEEAATDAKASEHDSPAITETTAKPGTGQIQSGGPDGHRPLGLGGGQADMGSSSQGSGEQGKNNGEQSAEQFSGDEMFAIKEEASQAQQHKAATTPLREQHTLAAQMNHSALANAETPQAHNSEHILDSVASKVNAENLQTQKNNLATLNEALNLRKDFAGPLKEKVMIMVNQKIQQVEIRLDPPELGNMHVRVNLQNEQAAVNFLVQSQQAKEALEQGMSKLKDMLSESGVDVGDANVEQQQQQAGEEQGFGHEQQGNGQEPQAFEQPDLVMQANLAQGMASGVDYYA